MVAWKRCMEASGAMDTFDSGGNSSEAGVDIKRLQRSLSRTSMSAGRVGGGGGKGGGGRGEVGVGWQIDTQGVAARGVREAMAERMSLASTRIAQSRAAVASLSTLERGREGREDPMAPISNTPTPYLGATAAGFKRDAVQKLFHQVGLRAIVGMVRYDDEDVRLHAVKVIANLAADTHNQGRIVEEEGLAALLDIFRGKGSKSNGEATCRIAAGALANLAMREANQSDILDSGAVELLTLFAHHAAEPQSHRMAGRRV